MSHLHYTNELPWTSLGCCWCVWPQLAGHAGHAGQLSHHVSTVSHPCCLSICVCPKQWRNPAGKPNVVLLFSIVMKLSQEQVTRKIIQPNFLMPNHWHGQEGTLDWSGDKRSRFSLPGFLYKDWIANLVNFHSLWLHPCQSLTEWLLREEGGGQRCKRCYCCRCASLRWLNVDPPEEVRAHHAFLRVQEDYLSLFSPRTPSGQRDTSVCTNPLQQIVFVTEQHWFP